MIPRFDFSQLRIETAAFALQLTSACMWSAGQHAEPTCESSIGVAWFITMIATAASEQTKSAQNSASRCQHY